MDQDQVQVLRYGDRVTAAGGDYIDEPGTVMAAEYSDQQQAWFYEIHWDDGRVSRLRAQMLAKSPTVAGMRYRPVGTAQTLGDAQLVEYVDAQGDAHIVGVMIHDSRGHVLTFSELGAFYDAEGAMTAISDAIADAEALERAKHALRQALEGV